MHGTHLIANNIAKLLNYILEQYLTQEQTTKNVIMGLLSFPHVFFYIVPAQLFMDWLYRLTAC